MTSLRIKRGTRAQLNSAASGSGLNAGEPYLITDESRFAVGLTTATYQDFLKVGEVSNGAQTVWYDYVATASQTTFAATYTVGFVDVYLNGLKLVPVSDFTASSGTQVVLASGAAAGDSVCIVASGTFAVANTYTQAQTDALLAAKQAALVSGANIKTVNGTSLVGSGDVAITVSQSNLKSYFWAGA